MLSFLCFLFNFIGYKIEYFKTKLKYKIKYSKTEPQIEPLKL